jgi:hypothetical protein
MDFPMDFGCFISVSSMFFLMLLIILNLTNAVLSKTTYLWKHQPVIGTRQLTKSIDFRPKLSLWPPSLDS